MFYYLKADLRGCHAGEKVKVVGKIGMYIKVFMNNEVVNVPKQIFFALFSSEPNITQEAYEQINRRPYSWIICKKGR